MMSEKEPLYSGSLFPVPVRFLLLLFLIPVTVLYTWKQTFSSYPYLYVLLGILCWVVYRRKRNQRASRIGDVNKKAVMITGCDTGFGNLLARRLDKLGMHVFATCLDASGSAAKELESACSGRMRLLQLDVTSDEQVSSCAAAVQRLCQEANLRGLWGLVNNGAILLAGPLEWMTTEECSRMMDVNFIGMFRVTKALLPILRLTEGRIVNVSSLAGRACLEDFGLYCASKHSVTALSNVLRLELERFRMSVSVVEPGGYLTPMMGSLSQAIARKVASLPETVRKAYTDEVVQQTEKRIAMSEKFVRAHLSEVPRVIEHALTAAYPHDSYCPHWTSHLMKYYFMFCPNFVRRWLIKRSKMNSEEEPLYNGSLFTVPVRFLALVFIIPAMIIYIWEETFDNQPYLYVLLLVVCCAVYLLRRKKDALRISDIGQKAVLITGCDTGFGNLLTRRLDKLGMHVFATCFDASGSSAKELKGACSERIRIIQLDVTSDKQVSACTAEVEGLCREAGLNGLWGVVNNAGLGLTGPVEWMTVEECSKLMDANFIGTFRVTKAFLPLLRLSKGRLVNVASVAGRSCVEHLGLYSATKHGVVVISNVLRMELQRFGIAVSTIEPSFYLTPMVASAKDTSMKRFNKLPREVSDAYKAEWPKEMDRRQAKALWVARTDLSEVTRVMEHALTAQSPQDSYCPHWTHYILRFIIMYCPQYVTNVIHK